jgi:eight-cysteine-cluster-containing protein
VRFTLLLLLACSGGRPAAESPAADPPVGSPPVNAEGGPDQPASTPGGTPADLYAACKDRVEGAGSAGECTTDADCVRTGCSSEVCVAKSAGQGMSTCEVLPCFAALDTCGCHEGQCSWRLKASVPTPGKLPLPVQ